VSVHLEAAARIGAGIVADTLWHRDRCTWLVPEPEYGADGRRTLAYRAAAGDLYDGTGGVALFLAELWAVGGDPQVRDAARGALRHAVEGPVLGGDAGLYRGRLGVAHVAARCAALLDDEEWGHVASALAAGTVGRAPRESDLLGGRAGAVLGLLALGDVSGDPGLVARALEMATSPPAGAMTSELTGLSHGAAGTGLALAALATATGDAATAAASDREFDHERRLFDARMGNWPDLREGRRGDGGEGSVSWCHGAAGIALSRLGAWRVSGDEICLAEISAALDVVEPWVRAAAHDPRASWCLCHGIAGNCEALLECASAVPTREESLRATVRAAVEQGLAEHDGDPPTWTCDPVPDHPGLMTGRAGIGLFLLRLAHPEIPSALLIGARGTQLMLDVPTTVPGTEEEI
jgi:lantibiotic modifying enzyme